MRGNLNLHQHSVARAASRIAKITTDNGDGTFEVDLIGGAGSLTNVASGNIGGFFPADVYVTLERAGPGWIVAGYAAYGGGDEE